MAGLGLRPNDPPFLLWTVLSSSLRSKVWFLLPVAFCKMKGNGEAVALNKDRERQDTARTDSDPMVPDSPARIKVLRTSTFRRRGNLLVSNNLPTSRSDRPALATRRTGSSISLEGAIEKLDHALQKE